MILQTLIKLNLYIKKERFSLKGDLILMRKMWKRIGCTAMAILTATSVWQASVMEEVFAKEATTVKMEGYENENALKLSKLGSYITGTSNKDGGVSEIISYDSKNNKAWVVNGATGLLDVIDLSNITSAVSSEMSASTIDVKMVVEEVVEGFIYGDMTSVSIHSESGYVAVAIQEEAYDKNGCVAILKNDGTFITAFEAGIQPDMITFTPDGSKILVANEGEPRNGYGDTVIDPAGSVTVITLNSENISESEVKTVGFEKFDDSRDKLVSSGVMFAKGRNSSTDLEPEYITATNTMAYVALQEANAIAVMDLNTGEFVRILALGYKDLGFEENAMDLLSDDGYNAKTYKDAVSAYMPDGISVYSVNGRDYILTANEGDAREWGTDEAEYVNESKEKLIATDGTEAEKIRVIDEDVVDGTPIGKKVLFGARSFSIFEVEEDRLTLVFDSANDFEKMSAYYLPEYFNVSNDDNEVDSRSQKKGPEPESVVVGQVDEKSYAFVALERIGGIMVYDITNPVNATYVNYINTRDFSEDPDKIGDSINYLKGDVAPEGMYFISANESPSKTPILLAAFEVSGTVAAYAIGDVPTKNEENNTIIDKENTVDNNSNENSTNKEESEVPNTGDEVNVLPLIVLMICIIGFVVLIKLSNKKVR